MIKKILLISLIVITPHLCAMEEDSDQEQPVITMIKMSDQERKAHRCGRIFAIGALTLYKKAKHYSDKSNKTLSSSKLTFYHTLIEQIYFLNDQDHASFTEGMVLAMRSRKSLLFPPCTERELKDLLNMIIRIKEDARWCQSSYNILSMCIEDTENELRQLDKPADLLRLLSSKLSSEISIEEQAQAFANGSILLFKNYLIEKNIKTQDALSALCQTYYERFCNLSSAHAKLFLESMIQQTNAKKTVITQYLQQKEWNHLLERIKDITNEYSSKVGTGRRSIEKQAQTNKRLSTQIVNNQTPSTSINTSTTPQTTEDATKRPLLRTMSEPFIRPHPKSTEYLDRLSQSRSTSKISNTLPHFDINHGDQKGDND